MRRSIQRAIEIQKYVQANNFIVTTDRGDSSWKNNFESVAEALSFARGQVYESSRWRITLQMGSKIVWDSLYDL